MKIVPDTNVLVSATFWKGNESEIIKLAEQDKIKLFLSEAIIEELVRVLNEKFSHAITKEKIQETVEHLITISTIIQPKTKINIVKEDPTDNKFIELAVEANADHIITGDKHLLKLKKFKEIEIINAGSFLKKQKY